jgi:IS4 transposase
MLPVTKIYSRNRKRRGRSKYLLSVEVELCDRDRTESIPARLVYVRKRGNRKEYLVLISTDRTLPEDEIIRIYSKRWDIEVFFKVCKSLLRLSKECRALSYDAMTAWIAIVFTRYMMLALENRIQKDDRSLGELFFYNCAELSDITKMEALRLLMEVFLEVAAEKYLLADNEIESLFEAFITVLPAPLRNSLLQCA